MSSNNVLENGGPFGSKSLRIIDVDRFENISSWVCVCVCRNTQHFDRDPFIAENCPHKNMVAYRPGTIKGTQQVI